MKIITKMEESNIKDKNIRWYLKDETIWITVYKEYAEVEKSIEESYGSFNWLYEVNDTILFEKETGKFRLAIIDLAGKVDVIKNVLPSNYKKIKGDLYLLDNKNSNFAFQYDVKYVKEKDCLLTYEEEIRLDNNTVEVLITNDFSFFILQESLIGWKLKNASTHLFTETLQETSLNSNAPEMISEYLEALKLWEKDENEVILLENLLETTSKFRDLSSMAIKECLNNILQI